MLIYRQYGSAVLKVVDIPQLFDFPVSITVDSPENYTFALFGKDDGTGIDEEPLFYAKFNDPGKNHETENRVPLCKLQLLSHLVRKEKQTVGKRKQMTPKLWLLPYPVVGVYSGRINSPYVCIILLQAV